jgi:hypothetical protein
MHNGKFSLALAGQERELYANFAFVEEIETRTIKKPIMALLNDALNGRQFISDMVSVIAAGLHANGDTRLSRAEIGEAVLKLGTARVIETYIQMLTFSITGETEVKTVDATEADKKK